MSPPDPRRDPARARRTVLRRRRIVAGVLALGVLVVGVQSVRWLVDGDAGSAHDVAEGVGAATDEDPAPESTATKSTAPESPAPESRATQSADAAAATPDPATLPVVPRGSGELTVVPGGSPRSGPGPLHRYRVEIEQGLGLDGAAFAGIVEDILVNPHGWGAGGRLSFQRADSGEVDFRVVLASPATTDELCEPLETKGIYSCHDGYGAVVINAMRWLRGTEDYRHDLTTYRQYLISHEVGHALGHGHKHDCRPDGLAPTMMQQTKSLYGCAKNPWPYPHAGTPDGAESG